MRYSNVLQAALLCTVGSFALSDAQAQLPSISQVGIYKGIVKGKRLDYTTGKFSKIKDIITVRIHSTGVYSVETGHTEIWGKGAVIGMGNGSDFTSFAPGVGTMYIDALDTYLHVQMYFYPNGKTQGTMLLTSKNPAGVATTATFKLKRT